jgi:hypothetical protein
MLRPADALPPDEGNANVDVFQVEQAMVSMNTILASVLHNFRIAHVAQLIERELGW